MKNYMYVSRAQKLPKKIVEKAGIPDDGCAGLRLGAEGPVSICSYKKTSNGRFSIDMLVWRTFVAGKNLHDRQFVLIVLRGPMTPPCRSCSRFSSLFRTKLCMLHKVEVPFGVLTY